MSATEMKADILKYIEQVDEAFIKGIHTLLQAHIKNQENPIIGYNAAGEPIFAKTAEKEYEKRVGRMKKGEFISVEDLAKESEKW